MIDLLQYDQYLFYLINSSWTTNWLDALMPLLRNKYFWLPVYTFIISFSLINFGKNGLYLLLFGVLTIAISDTLSSQVIKKTIKRVRPCNDILIKDRVELRVHCGGGYSFTSSHAANHFALAMFLIFTLGKNNRWIKRGLILWAGSIAYAQVYVGVHYPLDVLIGSFLGIFIGTFVATFYSSFKGFRIMD